MRLFCALANDIRYQAKYGFYLLYAFITLLYLGVLALVPGEYKGVAASVILLTDPAALGFFFIGGIWLLEKGEGVHRFYSISPLRPLEYCMAKVLSLSFISTLAGVLIAVFGVPAPVNYLFLAVGLLLGSGVFTLAGLYTATYAKSVNHYMLIGVIPGTVLIVPAVMTALGVRHFLLEMLPASILWRVMDKAVNGRQTEILPVAGLLGWLAVAALAASIRIPHALQAEGGASKNEANAKTVRRRAAANCK